MGQYYKPILLNEDNKPEAFVYSHDFGCGLKLMEHSWMKNSFVGFVEQQLINKPRKLVWAGDYAENEPRESLTTEDIAGLMRDGYEENDLTEGANLYSIASAVAPKLSHNEAVEDKYTHDFKTKPHGRFKYLVNHDKKEFVDKSKVPVDDDGWQIHPLPLLTCEGNGQGGGDFRGEEGELVGRWSRDKIGIVSKKSDIPAGFQEVVFDLVE